MLKAKDLVNHTVEELESMYYDLSREHYTLNGELRLNRKLDKPHLLKAVKKNRARVLTVINRKRLEGIATK